MNERERAAVRILAPFLTRHWRALAVSALSTVVLTLAVLAQPWPLKIVIDQLLQTNGGTPHITSSDLPLLLGVAGLVLLIAAVDAASSYWSDVLLNRAGERIAHDLRVAVYAHLQRLSLGFHDRRPKGDLVSRVTSDANAIGSLFSDSLGQITSAVLLLVGMAIVSFILDPVLALATFAVTPVLAFVTFRYRRRIKDLSRRQRAEEGEIASLATEALSAIQVVKAFGSEDYEYDRVHERSELRRRIGVDAARAQAKFSAVVDLLGAVSAALVLVLGVFRVSAGALSPGSLVVFATYAARTYKPLRDLARQSSAVSRAGARAERIAELLATDDALRDRPGAYAGSRAHGELEFENVSFAYTADRPALREVSLALAPGQRVAIVGRSGAGKSTLAALIARFYDPDTGCIRFDGRDARDCSLVWLREQVGILLQDTVLFRGSVADNIAYGSTADRTAIVAAARAAGAHEFVSHLPLGYDTELGAGGTGLSGGQRQRLGIARVLLRDPPILVLDEPTTGLDAASEARVVSALERLMEGRTTVIVTHSIALARRAGRVLVVENGRIVEDGTPDELLSNRGTFSRLALQQRLGHVEPAPRLRDDRLPQLERLLDGDAAASVLARTLRHGADLGHVVARTVTYKPGRRLVVTYDAVVDGAIRQAVVIADTKRDLAALAARGANVAAARRVNGRSPVECPLRFDPQLEVLVQWLPYDLELPLLREPPPELARRLAVFGIDADPAAEPRRLGYKPLHRVVLGVGEHIVKGYSSDAKYAASARGLRFAEASGLRTAALEARIDDLGATVQTALLGSVATDDTRLAPVAGDLIRTLHGCDSSDLVHNGPDRHLRAAAESARLVSAVLPELAARAGELVQKLADELPDDLELVASHGDFEVGQLLEHGSEVALLDFDELSAAPRALDIANYAAHSARRGGSAAALAVADAVVSSYGSRPAALDPYLAGAILVRAQAPFRKLENDWPTRVEALVTAAEDVLA